MRSVLTDFRRVTRLINGLRQGVGHGGNAAGVQLDDRISRFSGKAGVFPQQGAFAKSAGAVDIQHAQVAVRIQQVSEEVFFALAANEKTTPRLGEPARQTAVFLVGKYRLLKTACVHDIALFEIKIM